MTEQQKTNSANIKNDLMTALTSDFATSVKRIYINSLKREVGFKEITVTQLKILSRIMIDNEKRKDVVYDAQCAMINEVCLEKDNFNIYDLTEFDRLKLLIALYQANMFKNEVKFTCPECGTLNKFKLDFLNVLHRLDDIDISPKDFSYENDQWKYDFKVEYPTVKKVLEFHKSNVKKYRGANKQTALTIDNLSNMDYINLFIDTIDLTNKTTDATRHIDFADFNVSDIEEIISVFPQDVLYAEDGVLKFIMNEFISKMNDTFELHKCAQCGTKCENDVTGASSFL